MPKKLEGDPLVSPGIVSCAERRNNYIVQFPVPNGTIRHLKIFAELCRTILASLGGLKKVTIIVAFHYMKRRLKSTLS